MTSVIVSVNEKILKLMLLRNGRFTYLKIIFIDSGISFYSRKTNSLHPKPNSSFFLNLIVVSRIFIRSMLLVQAANNDVDV